MRQTVLNLTDCENRTGKEVTSNWLTLVENWLKNGEVVLGLATAHHEIDIMCRYVRKASLSDITDQSKRLC